MSTKQRSWLLSVLGLLLVLGVIAAIKVAQIRTMIRAGKATKPPPVAVTSAHVRAVELEQTTPAVATLVAVQGATLGAELSGLVREIDFESGSFVKRGQVLVRLDTTVERAELEGALAQQKLAEIQLEREQRLRRTNTNTQADLDSAVARAQQAESAVSTLRATIAKKTIRAPFDGRIAIRQIDLGQLVVPGTAVASLQSVSPIFADFWLPQDALAELADGRKTRLRVDVAPHRSWSGAISAINPQVDEATRNVRVRATFENADGFLRPGMFARIEVVEPHEKLSLLIPATAVMYAPYGDSVFVLEKQGGEIVARQRFVRLGANRGDFVAVESGLSAGEEVVGTGAFKLHGDTRVLVNDALAPPVSLAPKPGDE
jgi:membrane fusion protein (multidrug efflux system)